MIWWMVFENEVQLALVSGVVFWGLLRMLSVFSEGVQMSTVALIFWYFSMMLANELTLRESSK